MRAFHEIRNYPDGLNIWHGIYRDIGIIAHWHDETELIYLQEGDCVLCVNQQEYHAHAGDLIICEGGDIHYCAQHASDCCMEFLIFEPKLVQFPSGGAGLPAHHLPATVLEHSSFAEEWAFLHNRMRTEFDAKQPYYKELLCAQVNAIWSVCRRCSALLDTPVSSAPEISVSSVKQFRRTLDWLENHCTESVTLERAAQFAGFSASHFSRMFKKMTGIGFLEYLNMLRTSAAADMLNDTGMQITEIAYACGFGNLRTFNRVFQKNTGMTPTEFRKTAAEDRNFFTAFHSLQEYTTHAEQNPTILR